MEQVRAGHYYWKLKPGTKGVFYSPGKQPIPVTFLGMDGVEALIEGEGLRPRWHTGLLEGPLYCNFSWEVEFTLENCQCVDLDIPGQNHSCPSCEETAREVYSLDDEVLPY